MTIFVCPDRFEDMMTCIFVAWASRLGHRNVRLMTEPVGTMELFCHYQTVTADPEKTARVIRTIQKRLSYPAYLLVYRAAMSCYADKLDVIYRFLVKGFYYGADFLQALQEPTMARMLELSRKTANEAHFFREFARFSERENHVLVSGIAPKCDVLLLIAPHFADRLPSENFMIVDKIRRKALVHPADSPYYVTALSPEEYRFLTKKSEDAITELWKNFFVHISIKERKNSRCQRNMLPLWYRENIVEFTL